MRRSAVALEKRSRFFKVAALLAGAVLLLFLYFENPTVLSLSQGDQKVGRKEFFWNGIKIREEIDSNKDGKTDVWRHFTKGKPSFFKADTNLDGKVDTWGFYDGNGKLIRAEGDTDYNGKIDFSGKYYLRKKDAQ